MMMMMGCVNEEAHFFSELEYVASESLRLPPLLWNMYLYLVILIFHDFYFVGDELHTPVRIGILSNVLPFHQTAQCPMSVYIHILPSLAFCLPVTIQQSSSTLQFYTFHTEYSPLHQEFPEGLLYSCYAPS